MGHNFECAVYNNSFVECVKMNVFCSQCTYIFQANKNETHAFLGSENHSSRPGQAMFLQGLRHSEFQQETSFCRNVLRIGKVFRWVQECYFPLHIGELAP